MVCIRLDCRMRLAIDGIHHCKMVRLGQVKRLRAICLNVRGDLKAYMLSIGIFQNQVKRDGNTLDDYRMGQTIQTSCNSRER